MPYYYYRISLSHTWARAQVSRFYSVRIKQTLFPSMNAVTALFNFTVILHVPQFVNTHASLDCLTNQKKGGPILLPL